MTMAKRKPEEELDVLARLSERVESAIGTIGQLRRERDELRQKLAEFQSKAEDPKALDEEIERLRAERDEVRERIEKLLSRLEDAG